MKRKTDEVYRVENRREASGQDVVFVVKDAYSQRHLFPNRKQHGWVFVGDRVYPLYARFYDHATGEVAGGHLYFEGDEIDGMELVEACHQMVSEVEQGEGDETVKERVMDLRRRLTGWGSRSERG